MDGVIQIILFLLTGFNLSITFKEEKKYIDFIKIDIKKEASLKRVF